MATQVRSLFNFILITCLLSACGGGGGSSSKNTEQENARPSAAINYTAPASMEAPALLTFDGASSSDSDGNIVSYNWDFGDGNNSTQVAPTHNYSTAGTYTITLSVTDNDGSVSTPASTTITVTPAPSINLPPSANFSHQAVNGLNAPATINFDASTSSDSDGNIVSYSWDFGDGNNSTQVTPTHNYNTAGTYTVTLSVTDNEGAISTPATASITVTATPSINLPPSASFSYQANNGLVAPATINFDASTSSDSDGNIVSYNWDFGDGNSSTQIAPSHNYSTAGTYTVTLSVTDNDGASSTATPASINISNATSNYRAISLQSSVSDVQPMTGIVLWEDAWNNHELKNNTGNIQLEYAYVAYDSIASSENTYDWSGLDALLNRIANRQHQAIIRFYFTYPGRETTVPAYIKALPNYVETLGTTEGMATWFPDWSQSALESFHTSFYTAFAQRYDSDPRLAFLQVGFGLWAEYHIYDGPNTVGQQFPSKDYQTRFLNHLNTVFNTLHWSISIDAADNYYSPFSENAALRALRFGNFDDSFMHEEHAGYNAASWQFFNHEDRYTHSPQGGELSYYTDFDQRNVLNTNGIHGRTYEQLSTQYNITYMIGNDQPNYQTSTRIKEAGMANGYRFRITRFEANTNESIVSVSNTGIAPIYYDAYITINGIRASQSLKGLLPGEQNTYTIAAGGTSPTLSIESDRLVPGQRIQFDASLDGE